MIWLTLAAMAAQDMSPEKLADLKARSNPEHIRQVTFHPLFNADTSCSEHWAGQLLFPGDALGQDCMITGGISERGYASPYRTDGSTNDDWYGWGEAVLAPIGGTVARRLNNEIINKPGELGRPPANMIIIESEGDISIIVAHLGEVLVNEGDKIEPGQPIGTVGNNGYSRAPHIHIGASDKESALQIRWDLKAAANLRVQD